MRLVALMVTTCCFGGLAHAQDYSSSFSVEEGTFEAEHASIDSPPEMMEPLTQDFYEQAPTQASYEQTYQHAPRFHMVQNGRVQTADDFDRWLKLQGLTIGRAKPLPPPAHLSEQPALQTGSDLVVNETPRATLPVKQGAIVRFNPL